MDEVRMNYIEQINSGPERETQYALSHLLFLAPNPQRSWSNHRNQDNRKGKLVELGQDTGDTKWRVGSILVGGAIQWEKTVWAGDRRQITSKLSDKVSRNHTILYLAKIIPTPHPCVS